MKLLLLFFFITGVLRVFQQQKLSVRLLEKYFFVFRKRPLDLLWQSAIFDIEATIKYGP